MSVLNNSLKEFSGMLSIIQLSKFFVAVISDNSYILSRVIHFVNNFFIFSSVFYNQRKIKKETIKIESF